MELDNKIMNKAMEVLDKAIGNTDDAVAGGRRTGLGVYAGLTRLSISIEVLACAIEAGAARIANAIEDGQNR